MHVPNFLHAEGWTLPPSKSVFGHRSNQDMDPVPPSQRTWTTWNFIAYWVSDATHVAMWQFASSMLAVGLTWCDAPCSHKSPLHILSKETSFGRDCGRLFPYCCVYYQYINLTALLITFLLKIVMVLNGTVGARLHVGFPVLTRSSFGYWFSWFSVISRVVLAMFWFGILVISHESFSLLVISLNYF